MRLLENSTTRSLFNLLREEDNSAVNIDTYIGQYEYQPDLEPEESFMKSGDSSYFTIVKTAQEAEKFNYHSDYWGSAEEYQNDNVELVSSLEDYIKTGDKLYFLDDDGEKYTFSVTGVAIDRQYNSISHTKILIKEDTPMAECFKSKRAKRKITEAIKLLRESSDIIWTTEISEDDYDKEEIKNNQYQDYLDSFTGEGTEHPKDFDDWFYDYMADDSYDMSEMIMDDFANNVGPMIDKQVNGAIFITGNYNSNYPEFRKSGPGGKIVKDSEDLLNWLSEEDVVRITNNDGQLGVQSANHDGSIGGLMFTLPDDPNEILEIAKSTGYYNEEDYGDSSELVDEFMYDLSSGNVTMRDIKKVDTLVPIKNGFLIEESEEVEEQPNVVMFYLNGKELGGHDLANEFEGERESARELFAYENGVSPEEIEVRLEYRPLTEGIQTHKNYKQLLESKKDKQPKQDTRVVMQQGNVTCIKEGNTYLVFENESDNEVEYDSEDSAMQDFLERVGVDPNNELEEK